MESKLIQDIKKVYVSAGDIIITDKKNILWTVLGSCVTVIFFHKPTGLTAMCHAQLPEPKNHHIPCSSNCSNPCYNSRKDAAKTDFSFVSCSINYMFDFFAKKNIQKSQIQVYLLGGSSIFSNPDDKNTVGNQNIAIAERYLANIPNITRDIGGIQGRTISFDIKNNEINIRRHT